jgi:hypothetical protein
MELGFSDYILIIGQLTFPYQTTKTLEELAKHIQDKINEGHAFILTMDRNGPKLVLNPSPGMAVVVMTKEHFERNRGIQRIVGAA